MTIPLRLLLFSILLFPHLTEARSLFWQDIQVDASLDKDGRPHVREQQTMVFSGDWNGGERKFNIRPSQKMQFEGISRLDSTDQESPLVKGNLDQLDHWDYNGTSTIRWRARMPTAPVFDNTRITYVLHYSLSHILTSDQEGYLLDHDFCFPDRSGIVKNFDLHLEFDPVWQLSPTTIVRKDIAPGKGVVLRQHLSFTGADSSAILKEQPPVAATPAPNWLRMILLCILLTTILWRTRLFYQWENSLNRFADILPTEAINQQWLDKELFIHKPEVVGATWDKTTSTAEVAAVLARLVQEGRMKSWMEPYVLPFFNIRIPGIRPILHLRLLEPKKSFKGYENQLIKGLFVGEGLETDSKTIRDYYQKKRKSFDPVTKINKPLKKQMKKLTGDGKNPLKRLWMPTLVLAVLGFFLLLANAFLHLDEFLSLQIFAVPGIIFFWIGGIISALSYRGSVISLARHLFIVFFSIFCTLVGFCIFLLLPASTLLILGVFCMAAAISNNIINLSRSKESAAGLALRRRMAAARKYFQQELTREKPQISDSWFPYLLAFGLGPQVDSWFRSYGKSVSYGHSVGNAPGGSSGSGFTGGGRAFGGGGASGSWSTAVGSFAASASSSSSGSGSSGSSSGGGGGGGW
jgi:uncharacterized membrane protein YgcG